MSDNKGKIKCFGEARDAKYGLTYDDGVHGGVSNAMDVAYNTELAREVGLEMGPMTCNMYTSPSVGVLLPQTFRDGMKWTYDNVLYRPVSHCITVNPIVP